MMKAFEALGEKLRGAFAPLSKREPDRFRIGKTSFRFQGFSHDEVQRFARSIAQIRFSRSRLRVQIVDDAVLSRLQPLADGNMLGGVFDAHGTPIAEAQIYREGEGVVVGFRQAETDFEPEIVPEALYGGVLFSGFGHIILESACRLWAAPRYADLPILFQSPPGTEGGQETLLKLAEILGISVERIRFTGANIRVCKLIVPQPGLVLGREVNSEYLRFVRSHRATAHEPASARGRVYLSRAGLNWRQRRAIGEVEMERALRSCGVEVVRPETLSLIDQVAIHDQATTLSGFIGSQFHTLFLRTKLSPIDVLYLCSSRPNINFFQIDLLFPGHRIYSNIALYEPGFEFGNRSPFYFSADCVAQMLHEIGWPIENLPGPEIADFIFNWSLAYFYFKVFRQGLLSEDFTKVAEFRLRRMVKGYSRKLTESERLQVLRAYDECARRYRVTDNPEVRAGAIRLEKLLARHI